MDTVIQLDSVGKKYLLNHQRQERYTALRDVIVDKVKGLPELFKKGSVNSHAEDFWALKNVSFEVKQGDRLGIIGRNGAGKSTLLKIISRITEPTQGAIGIKGRVASLLEVGTGFHPELTGRENIFLNGSILGMSMAEIKSKFDEIVDFSEVEQFLDTPVKRFSSGMFVRLAFAVAAHLEPEILIVDEVLAVGDLQFQKKCLNKMQDVGKNGKTVIFVSHQMDAIRKLCTSCLWLNKGEVLATGTAQDVVTQYERSSVARLDQCDGTFVRKKVSSSKEIWVSKVELIHPEKGTTSQFEYRDDMLLSIEFDGFKDFSLQNYYVVWQLKDDMGRYLSASDTTSSGYRIPKNSNVLYCRLSEMPLYKQKYWLEIGIGAAGSGRVDTWDNEVFFDIVYSDPYGTGVGYDSRSGVFHIQNQWGGEGIK